MRKSMFLLLNSAMVFFSKEVQFLHQSLELDSFYLFSLHRRPYSCCFLSSVLYYLIISLWRFMFYLKQSRIKKNFSIYRKQYSSLDARPMKAYIKQIRNVWPNTVNICALAITINSGLGCNELLASCSKQGMLHSCRVQYQNPIFNYLSIS